MDSQATKKGTLDKYGKSGLEPQLGLIIVSRRLFLPHGMSACLAGLMPANAQLALFITVFEKSVFCSASH
jgi:hypothetical protein